MKTKAIDLLSPNRKSYLSDAKHNWTLCVGAGICKGILPDWIELTNRLVNRCFGFTWDQKTFKEQSDLIGFSLDSWIQGCLNRHIEDGKNLEEFNNILEEELYRDMLAVADAKPYLLGAIIRKLFYKPRDLKPEEIIRVCDFFEKEYRTTTLMHIVNVLTHKKDEIRLPDSIVTFNADSLLYSLLIVFSIKKRMGSRPPYRYPKELYRKITKPYHSWAGNIPVFHLHGSISPAMKSKKKGEDSRDNLIFLESSYTKVAGSMFSWAQSNFLFLAQNNRLVFVGLSMSDPNIRRWLSWTAENYQDELNKKNPADTLGRPHLWIKTRMKSAETQNFIDVSLHHLGVKVGLIDSWDLIGNALQNIMTK